VIQRSSDTRPQRDDGPDGRLESAAERLDRNLEELNAELRVIVTGVQVLFAFLLVVPFNSGFSTIGDFGRVVYFVTLLLAALAAMCMIAPSAQHRLLFRRGDKSYLVFAANRLAIAGIVFLALAMCGSLLLVATRLFGILAGVLTVLLGALPFAATWFAMPLRRRAAYDAAARRVATALCDRRADGNRPTIKPDRLIR
jgi:Family of unknown function (DUF6328)